MPAPANFQYRLDADPTEKRWEDSCFPCSDEDVALNIVEEIEHKGGTPPTVVHLLYSDDPRSTWVSINIAEAKATQAERREYLG